MKVYTDASVIEEGSIHSYVIYDKSNKVMMIDKARAYMEDTVAAEMLSVVNVLAKCKKMMIKNVTIHTDSVSVVGLVGKNYNKNQQVSKSYKKYQFLISKIKTLLKAVEGTVKWVSRKRNTVADKLCREGRKMITDLKEISLNESTIISTGAQFRIKSGRVVTHNLVLDGITSKTVTEEDIQHIQEYYRGLVEKDKRTNISSILEWGEGKMNVNSKRGRRYFVEKYIEENHDIQDLQIKFLHNAFDVV